MLIFKIVLLSYLYSIDALSLRVSQLGSAKVIFDLKEADELFEDFVETYHKNYSDKNEYERRFKIFKTNLVEINKLNRLRSHVVFSINELSDLRPEEILGNFTLPDVSHDEHEDNGTIERLNLRSDAAQVPKEWDWRKKNVVTPAKSQGMCQSCWAFASVACIESQNAIKTNKLIALSQQQLVDCLGHKCEPYYPDRAMREVAAKMDGLMTYADYPYESASKVVGKCRWSKDKVAVRIKGGDVMRTIQNEEDLKHLIYKYGPVVTGMYVSNAFVFYRDGIATPENLKCRENSKPNHAVVIVGYGTEDNVPYWIVKNSLGPSWGEDGYMRLLRGKNACKILYYVAVAEL